MPHNKASTATIKKLTDEHIEHILNAFIERADKEHFARLVPNAEIVTNNYNIAILSYIEQKDTREAINITVLYAKIAEIVQHENELRRAIDEIVKSLAD